MPRLKERIIWMTLTLLGFVLLDHPRRAVSPDWQSGLIPKKEGQFVIRREGDLTLKYVNARYGEGNLEMIPVPFYGGKGPGTQSVKEIARRFGMETQRSVVAAVNGGFFDTRTGLPIGFLLRSGQMEFFNMPQGFTRSMVGFRPLDRTGSRAHALISSPREMPKVWMETLLIGPGRPARSSRLAVHHINIPSGKHALALFTPTYGKRLRLPEKSIYMTARPEEGRPGVYRVTARHEEGTLTIPSDGLVVALHGDARAKAGMLREGALIRPTWSLPKEWLAQGVTHGLLAGPRLLENGQVQVTAKTERLHLLKSRDRVALGVKNNGDLLLIWVHKNTAGNLTFEQVARVLTKLGAVEAIALDGGRSRAILAQSGWAPADERYYEGGRPVANALVLVQTPKSKV